MAERVGLRVLVLGLCWPGAWAGEVAYSGAEAVGVLRSQCFSCHSEEKRKGGLDLTTRAAVLSGGDNGAVVVEGKPEESSLIGLLAPDADPHMPPKKQLDSRRIEMMAEWVRRGLPWDEAVVRVDEPAMRPVALGPVPAGYRPVMALALSPDGRTLAAGCGPDLVLFELGQDGLVVRGHARGHFDPIQSIAWSPDGQRLVTGAFRRVLVWKASPLTPEREVMSGLTDRITAVQMLAGGTKAVLADGLTAEKGIVRILDVPTGAIERSWPAHDDTIFALAVSPDGAVLATAGGDSVVRLWNLAEGLESARIEAHATQVLGLAFNADATQLVTAGADRQMKVWDAKTLENIVALPAKPSPFNAVAWQASGPVFAVSEDGSVWRYTDLKPHTGAQSSETGNERQIGRAEAALFCLATTADGNRIFAGTSDGHLLEWDAEGKPRPPIDISAATVSAATAVPAPAATTAAAPTP